MRSCVIGVLLGLVLTAVGCGGGGAKVTGKVTFADGQPLTVGKVMFTNGTTTAYGKINASGEYRMGMLKDGDGVPPGTYQVYITEAFREDASLSYKDSEGDTVIPRALLVAPKLTVPSQSGLTCEVKGAMKYDITVEPPGKDYNPLPNMSDLPKPGVGD